MGRNAPTRFTFALSCDKIFLLSEAGLSFLAVRAANPPEGTLPEMMRYTKKQPSEALYEAILSLNSLEECERFFEDLCTENELRSIEQRYNVAAYLMQDMVYADILEKTGASSATISRVRRNILYRGSVMPEVIARQQGARAEAAPDTEEG